MWLLVSFWKQLWKSEREFFHSGSGEFRHGTSFVAVSSIAEQYYCEYKLENEFAVGEIPTEAKDSGTSLHDELMPTERISQKEFVKLVSKEEPTLAVLGVWGSAGGLKVVGVPDHIVWSKGKPLWVIELKTTKGDPNPLWEDQEKQVRMYGLLLDKMGFDCSGMRLAVVRLKAVQLGGQEKKEWVLKVSAALMWNAVGELEAKYQGRMKIHILNHDAPRAEEAVRTMSGYWLGDREPSSSTSEAKCKACEYNGACAKSLYKPT
jgi:hypothetical protein